MASRLTLHERGTLGAFLLKLAIEAPSPHSRVALGYSDAQIATVAAPLARLTSSLPIASGMLRSHSHFLWGVHAAVINQVSTFDNGAVDPAALMTG